MHRFIALSWNAAEQRSEVSARTLSNHLRSHSRLQWHAAFSHPGLLVLYAGPPTRAFQAYELAEQQGVILGKLYRGAAAHSLDCAPNKLSHEDSRSIVASGARRLTQEYWGRYVAFIQSPAGEKYILRDPTGALPCYYAELDSIVCLFSDIRDYLQLRPTDLGIDWAHVAAYLCFSRIVSNETGFAGIRQLRAGECRRISEHGTTDDFYWHPVRIGSERVIEEPRSALLELRGAIEASVRSWAGCYRKVLLELSGGLDSSIILSCLAQQDSGLQIACLNMYTEAPEGDERPFARKAAARAGVELIETIFEPRRRLAQMLVAEPLISPTMVSLNSEAEDFRAQLAIERKIEAIFTGRGGDQLFQRRRGSFIAKEYVHRHGLHPGLLRIVLETAGMTRNSVWPVLAEVLKYWMFRRAQDPYWILKPPRFLHADLASLAHSPRLHHPWVSDAGDLPESKAQQIFDIVDTQNYFLMGTCDYADVVPALLSQPVLECVLRIPSYILTYGGTERGLVRKAFEAAVPTEIIRRTSKGEVVGFYLDLLRADLPFLREFLLDGKLVQQHLLDRRLLEAALSESQLIRAGEVVPLLIAVKAEHWLRSVPQAEQATLRTSA